MKLEKQEVIKELQTITERQIHHLEQWALLDKEMLNQQPSNGGWSVLECMEHLRRYMEVYLPESEAQAVIDIAKQFNIDAQIIGRVEKAEHPAVRVESPYGTFDYDH